MTATFSPATIPAPGSGISTLTISGDLSLLPGTYALTVTGSGGGIFHTVNLSVVVGRASLSVYSVGARGDGQLVTDGNIQSLSPPYTLTTTSSCLFASTDIGKSIVIAGANPSGSDLISTITWVGPCKTGQSVTFQSAPGTLVANATVLWGTDDGPAFQNAGNTAFSCSEDVFIPPAQKQFYLILTRLRWSLLVNLKFYGAGANSGSWVIGAVGNNPIFTFATNSVTNIEVTGLRLDNFHTSLVGELSWPVLTCSGCSRFQVHDNLITLGRGAVSLNTNAMFVDLYNLQCNGTTDLCLVGGGATGVAPNKNIVAHDNQVQNTVFTRLGDSGHDINWEDTQFVQTYNNTIVDNPSTVPGVSCIHHYIHYATGGLSYITDWQNTCTQVNPQAGTTVGGIAIGSASPGYPYNSLILDSNTITGSTYAVSVTGIYTDNQLNKLVIVNDTATNCGWTGDGCLYITSGPGSGGGPTHQDIHIQGGNYFGVGGVSGGPGIALGRLSGVTITGTTVHNMAQQGFVLAGVQNGTFASIYSYDNGKSGFIYDGIACVTYSAPDYCVGNSFNYIHSDDDDLLKRQRYGLYLGPNSSSNSVVSPNWTPGNAVGNYLDLGSNNSFH